MVFWQKRGRLMRAPIFILALASILLLAHPTVARDAKGFSVGGGVGGVMCPAFLNAMATARQKGGLRSTAGVQETSGFEMFLSGFQTGFNSEADGIYDIFEALGPDPTLQALYAIEPWCASHPDKTFATAVVILSSSSGQKNGRCSAWEVTLNGLPRRLCPPPPAALDIRRDDGGWMVTSGCPTSSRLCSRWPRPTQLSDVVDQTLCRSFCHFRC